MAGLPGGTGQTRIVTPTAESDTSGNVTLTFPTTNVNATMTGVVSVPLSGLNVVWTVYLNDVAVGTMTGPSQYGPLQASSTMLRLRTMPLYARMP